MTDHTKIKIAKAFYLKGRNAFVPLTADDIANRTKLNPDAANSARHSMMLCGFLVSTRCKGEFTYDLTPAGRALVGVAA